MLQDILIVSNVLQKCAPPFSGFAGASPGCPLRCTSFPAPRWALTSLSSMHSRPDQKQIFPGSMRGLFILMPHAECRMGNRKMGNGPVLAFLWSAGKKSLVRKSLPRSAKQQGIWKVKQEDRLQFQLLCCSLTS